MVVTGSDRNDLKVIFFEELDSLRYEGGLDVTVTESPDLLGVHPVEEALLATVTPSINFAIISESHSMVLTHDHIDNLVVRKSFDEFRRSELDILLVSMTEHSPVTLSKGVQLAVL